MPITLVTGPQNSGKSAAVIAGMRESLKSRSAMAITPCRHTASQLMRRLINESPEIAAFPRDAVMEWRLFTRLLADPSLPVIGPVQSSLLISRIFPSAHLSYFKSAFASSGLSGQFAASIAALKRNLIPPEKILKMAKKHGSSSREADLAAIYSLYERETERLGIVDEAGLTSLAVARVRSGEESPLTGISSLFLDEFHRFTPGETALVAAIKRANPKLKITVTLPSPEPCSPRGEIFREYLEESRERILPIVDEEIAFEAPAKGYEPKIRIVCTRSPAQEARFVAKLVAELSSEGLSPEEVAVAADPGGTFVEWLASEALAMGVIPDGPCMEGAFAGSLLHELFSPGSIERIPAKGGAAELASSIREAAVGDETLGIWASALSRHPSARCAVAKNAKAAEDLVEALASVEAGASLVEVSEFSRDDFVRMLRDALPGGRFFSSDDARFPFHVVSPGSPLAAAQRASVIPRMVEGCVPRPFSDPPFFLGWDDEDLKSAIPNSADAHAAAAYTFESILAKSRERIFLVYPAVNEGGSENLRSAFMDSLLEDNLPPEYAEPIIPEPSRAREPNWERDMEKTIAVEQARKSGRRPPPGFGGELSAEESIALVRRRFTEGDVKVTALERYARCPFVFFVESVLRAKELPDDTPELAPAVRGNVVHRILRRFYEEHAEAAMEARRSPSKETLLPPIVKRISDEVWEEYGDDIARISAGLRERGREAIERMALQVIEAETDEARHLPEPLSPRECEWPFGRGADRPLFIPVAGDIPASISGRIDRVDSGDGDESFLVIDYKTGASGPVTGDMKKGLHLQLPLYVDAAARLLFPSARPLGGLIVDVKNAQAGGEDETPGKSHGFVRKSAAGLSFRIGRKKSALGEEEFEAAIESARKSAARCIEGIRAGKFSPRPNEYCRNCNHADICRQKDMASD